jgi:purine nucleosidase
MTGSPRRLVLDTDPGLDDAFAIAYAARSPEVEVVALTTVFGNVPVEVGTANALDLLERAGLDGVPVHAGAAGPLDGRVPGYARHVHGEHGRGTMGPAAPRGRASSTHAAVALCELVAAEPGAIDLVAVGPLTNVALAVALRPTFVSELRSLSILAGTGRAPGNVTPTAEANAANDPVALGAVLGAVGETTLVTLDATMRVEVDDAALGRLGRSADPLSRHIAALLDDYASFYESVFGRHVSVQHDAVAVAVGLGLWPATIAPRVRVQVDTGYGPARGAVLADLRGAYSAWPEQRDARCTVVLEAAEGLADHMVAVIAG